MQGGIEGASVGSTHAAPGMTGHGLTPPLPPLPPLDVPPAPLAPPPLVVAPVPLDPPLVLAPVPPLVLAPVPPLDLDPVPPPEMFPEPPVELPVELPLLPQAAATTINEPMTRQWRIKREYPLGSRSRSGFRSSHPDQP